MSRFRFRGEFTPVDIDLIVADSPALRTYVDRLAGLRLRNGQKVGRRRAQAILTRLLTGAFDRIGGEYINRYDGQMRLIANLRKQLAERYSKVLDLFRPGAPRVRSLPADLRPQSIAALFDELDQALDQLEQRTSRDGMKDAMDHVGETRDARDYLTDVENRRAGDVEPVGREPELDLDSPDQDFTWRVRGEHDRAALARYRERMRLLPENRRRRAEVRAEAVQWALDNLPEGTTVTLFRVPDYSEGNLAALARFSQLDPRFSGRGYEVQIRLEDGTTFRPDGIRFLDDNGRRFQFLESKEPYTWTEGSFYATPEGQRVLVAMLHRDAAIAQRLRPNGCVGFQYRTGHPDLDRVLAEAIADMRANGIGGADLLAAPGGLD
jgi:hypothetical protein